MGVFNTTSQGTDTINGSKGTMSGSVFKMPAYVHVHARTKIDYSEKKTYFYDKVVGHLQESKHLLFMTINLTVNTGLKKMAHPYTSVLLRSIPVKRIR
ncbi:hypothetical protein UA45_00570 [Morganella morganii]|uniref:Uncharacterized protein n=1 Tax=Morganella morganii TaxID=582 RepID=A0A0D8LBU8_MORMO|nr:hypothetical protein UA45_00570 [Morganella morganii]